MKKLHLIIILACFTAVLTGCKTLDAFNESLDQANNTMDKIENTQDNVEDITD